MSKRRLSLSLALTLVALLSAGGFAVWAFPLQGRERERAPADVPGGRQVEGLKRGRETNSPDSRTARIRVGGNVQTKKLIHWVPPEYPEEAQSAGVKGTVLMKLTITEAGDVSQVEVVHGHPMLVKAAEAAARQWKYSPTMLNGQAVPVIATQTVSFPPGIRPEFPSPSSPRLFPLENPENVQHLLLDEAGSLWLGGKHLEGSDLTEALQGKELVVLTLSPATLPSSDIMAKTVKMLESAGVRVQVSNVRDRAEEIRSVLPLEQLTKAVSSLGYESYRWIMKEDGRQTQGFQGFTADAREQATAGSQQSNSDPWKTTVTYQLERDADSRVTVVRQVGGPSIPEMDQVVSTMVGKTMRRYFEPRTIELEISLR